MADKADDLIAFLDAADTPETTRSVCAKPSLITERDRLRGVLYDLEPEDGDDKPKKGRLGEKSPRAQVEKQLAEVDKQIEAASMLFRFRPLTPSRVKDARDAVKAAKIDPDDHEANTPYVHAAQCVEPAGMTAADFAKLREAWGIPYYDDNISAPASEATRSAVGDPFGSTGR